jgi:hypothetical protein
MHGTIDSVDPQATTLASSAEESVDGMHRDAKQVKAFRCR